MQFEGVRILVTGGAGFIGSHLVERLLREGAFVVVLDNFSTGKRENVMIGSGNKRFQLIEGDIRNKAFCEHAVAGCDFVLHQAALGSVARSILDPLNTFEINAGGFANMISAAKNAKVKRFIYASSSSVYGDDPSTVKREDRLGVPLSPYAVAKRTNELLALNFSKVYGFETIGLRYFNIFGPRQNPNGPYAAVIPKFIAALKRHESPVIYGDGTNSRDFTYVENVVNANMLALTTENPEAINQVYNIACGESTSLNELFEILRKMLSTNDSAIMDIKAQYAAPRQGDIAGSLAEIEKAKKMLNYQPSIALTAGLYKTQQTSIFNCGNMGL